MLTKLFSMLKGGRIDLLFKATVLAFLRILKMLSGELFLGIAMTEVFAVIVLGSMLSTTGIPKGTKMYLEILAQLVFWANGIVIFFAFVVCTMTFVLEPLFRKISRVMLEAVKAAPFRLKARLKEWQDEVDDFDDSKRKVKEKPKRTDDEGTTLSDLLSDPENDASFNNLT